MYAITTMMISACVWEKERERDTEEKNSGKKKSFIDGLGKWKENNAHNEKREKEIASNKISLNFNK